MNKHYTNCLDCEIKIDIEEDSSDLMRYCSRCNRLREAEAVMKLVGRLASNCCVNECPVNTEEFGGKLLNPQDCKRGCQCLARDVWFALLTPAPATGKDGG